MKKIIEAGKLEKCIYYSDLGGGKINLNVNQEILTEPSFLSLNIPTEGYEEEWDGTFNLIKDCEKLNIQISTNEAIQILKYLRKKYPKNKNLKTYLFVK